MRDKITYLRKIVSENVNLMKSFSFFYGLGRLAVGVIPGRIRSRSRLCKKISRKCDYYAMNYLEKKFSHVIDTYNYQQSSQQIQGNSNIWVFWYQGKENAPAIVKACIDSIRRNAGDHPVIVLDYTNFADYVSFPDYVMRKFHRGSISHTHFSDLLRVELLYAYGGIWMDATMFMTRSLDKMIKDMPFYTINHGGQNPPALQSGKWTSFFLASGKGNSLIGLLRKLFLEYWKEEEELIIYLLIDYFLTLIYENVEEAKDTINSVPISNQDMFLMYQNINKDKSLLKKIQNCKTYLFKLSYKGKFADVIDGKETIYYNITQNYR